jgi:hypothetical protein
MSYFGHRFTHSKPKSASRDCPKGYHLRSAYTVKSTGKYVPSRCVQSTTVYDESQKQFRSRLQARSAQRIRRSITAKQTKPDNVTCPDGMILRKGYVRHFRNTVKSQGYKQHRRGKTVLVRPRATNIYVKPGCIQNRGLAGKGVKPGATSIAPLRQGELLKHGYSSKIHNTTRRHRSLRSAVKEFGPLGVYRKLNAVAKLSTRTAPKSSALFAKNRDWIRRHYSLKAFQNE